jgi:hypothetical protein
MESIALQLSAGSSMVMVGLIWFVQVVHYPLMAQVGTKESVAYAARHQSRTTLVVAPTMFVELGASIAVAVLLGGLGWLALALVGAVWASTFFVQVPLHARLSEGFDASVHCRLVATNWFRTALWTAKGLLSMWMLTG